MITLEMEWNCPHCGRPTRKVAKADTVNIFINITCPNNACKQEYALKLKAKVLTPEQAVANEL